jgi:hypothetical protein
VGGEGEGGGARPPVAELVKNVLSAPKDSPQRQSPAGALCSHTESHEDRQTGALQHLLFGSYMSVVNAALVLVERYSPPNELFHTNDNR